MEVDTESRAKTCCTKMKLVIHIINKFPDEQRIELQRICKRWYENLVPLSRKFVHPTAAKLYPLGDVFDYVGMPQMDLYRREFPNMCTNWTNMEKIGQYELSF